MKKFYDQYIQVYIPKMWQNVFLKMKGSGLDPRHYPGHVANPFQGNVPLLHPLELSENTLLSDIFRRYRRGTLT